MGQTHRQTAIETTKLNQPWDRFRENSGGNKDEEKKVKPSQSKRKILKNFYIHEVQIKHVS